MNKIFGVLLMGVMMSGMANASVGNKPDMIKIKKVFKQVEKMKYSNRTPVSEPTAYKILFPELVKVYYKPVKNPQLIKTALKKESPKETKKKEKKPNSVKSQIPPKTTKKNHTMVKTKKKK